MIGLYEILNQIMISANIKRGLSPLSTIGTLILLITQMVYGTLGSQSLLKWLLRQ